MSALDDELAGLVPLAREGDRRALQRIITLVYPSVIRYCRGRIGSGFSVAADDVAQEICLALTDAIHTYQDQGRPFMAFVYGIASNKVADAKRSLARNRVHPTEEVPDTVDPRATPEETALTVAGSNDAARLLDHLSDKAREIIILRVIVGLSAEETAKIMGSTPGAIRVSQHRALNSLRKILSSEKETG